jgi:Flp pilus assembly protein TadB
MDNTSWVFLAVALALFVAFIVLSMKTNKTKKLRITTAETDNTGQPKVIEVTRKWNDSWNDIKDLMAYRDNDGKRIWLAKHWILKIEEI